MIRMLNVGAIGKKRKALNDMNAQRGSQKIVKKGIRKGPARSCNKIQQSHDFSFSRYGILHPILENIEGYDISSTFC